MDWKKYFILFIPATIIFVVVLFTLPTEYKTYSMSIPLVFWIVYYAWKGMDEKKNKGEFK